MRKKTIVVMLVIVFIMTAVGCNKTENKEYVAKVNGKIITQTEFDKRVNQAAAMNNFNLGDPQLAAYKDMFKLQILDRMIDEILLEDEANNRKLKVNKEDVDAEITSIKGQFDSNEEFKRYFEEQLKMTEKDIKEAIETQLLIKALYEDVTKDITSTDTDIQKYYEEHQEEFYQEEQVKARHILVKTEEEAKEIIKQIVDEGQDMAQLAVLKSIEPSAKDTQGDLGYFGRGVMVKPFEDAVFALDIGEITKTPVQTTYGYHVIRVEDKLEAKQRKFEEVKDELEERFIFREKSAAFTSFVNELRNEAEIENKLEEKIKAEQEKAAEEQEKADKEENKAEENNDKKEEK